MAGLAVIASSMNFNAEIIKEEHQEGYLLKKNYALEMADIIRKFSNDRILLNKVKEQSYQSRKRYAIEEYQNMLNDL